MSKAPSPDVRRVRLALEARTQHTSKRLPPAQFDRLLNAIDPLVAKLNTFKNSRAIAYKKPERKTVKGLDPFDPEVETDLLLFPAKVGDAKLRRLFRIHQQLEAYSQLVREHQRAHLYLERSRRLLQRAYTDLSAQVAVAAGDMPKRSNSVPDEFATELLFQVADTFCNLDLPLVSTPDGPYYQTAAALLRVEAIAHHRVMRAIRDAQGREAIAHDARERRRSGGKRE